MKKPKLRTIGKIAGIGGTIALESGIINTGNIMSKVKSTSLGGKMPDVNGLASKATAGIQQKAIDMATKNMDTSQLMGDIDSNYTEQVSNLDQANLAGVEALKGVFNKFM